MTACLELCQDFYCRKLSSWASQPTLLLQLFSSVRPSVTSKNVILYCFIYIYKHESCGQCTSCREGMLNMLNRMVEDRAWHRIEANTSWIHACLPVSSLTSSVYSRLNTTNKLNGRRSARLVQHDPSKVSCVIYIRKSKYV